MGHTPGKLSQDHAHSRLLWVLVVSSGLHLLAYGGLKWGSFLDSVRHSGKMPQQETVINVTLAQPPPPKKIILPPSPKPKPKTLVEVPSDRATQKKPENPDFYSDKNAKAANPTPPKETISKPKLEGSQFIIPKLENTVNPTSKPQPPKAAKPVPPASKPVIKPTPPRPAPTKPKSAPPVKVAKVAPPPTSTTASAKPTPTTPKPGPTLAQALKALPKDRGAISGRALKQDGGVKRIGKPSFDVRLTGYGSYDLKLTAAISRRWHQLLEIHNAAPGQVVIEFDLFAAGQVRNVRLISNTVGPLHTFVCEHAITDPAPFDVWSKAMRQEIGADRKHCRITFSYIPR